MIERGELVDNFDDEEAGQSEDDSNASGAEDGNQKRTRLSDAAPKLADMKTSANLAAQSASPQLMQPMLMNNGDYNKMLVVGEGFGRDFLKSEIERLIRVL